MLTGTHKAKRISGAAMTAAAVLLCAQAALVHGQRSGAAAPRSTRPPANAPRNPGPVYPMPRPVGPARPYPGPPYMGPGFPRPGYPVYAPSTPGHLGEWLNQHRNLPAQEQERALRNDPSFRRLPAADQQRVIEQLHKVRQLTPEQQQRMAARVEMLERLSPQERMQVDLSARRWLTLPVDRQAPMKRAFQDLRAVPPDQRHTVLKSARYKSLFSSGERGILSDLLRVEPYQPARP